MKIVYSFLLALYSLGVFAQKDSAFAETPLVLHTATGDIMGTLTLPKGGKKVPVALIHSGSGPTDRNGNNPVMQNNGLQMLAHALGEAGIATLRFDKRGVAASKAAAKSEADMRFDDFVQDAKAWVELLKKDPRFSGLYILGHSEGSLIGMIAAAGKADAFISLAGPGRPAAVVLKEQFAAQPSMVKNAAYPILDSLAAGKTVGQVPPYLLSVFRASVQPYMVSWFKYDPAKELAKLNIPILVVQGTTDMQVSVEDAVILQKANPKARLLTVPNMNHVLKTYEGTSRQENFATYSKPELPLHPLLAKEIISFLKGIR
ncbi:hypothetical protein SAMN05444008_12229 [Cnuella takakiae]|uniref:Serine aminopeptidase S33 domain-containing protein n=1 Tax=Cnuella takakiae TaxID=1302690 RepID=A0A1M5I714_9BACT|nr:alpha/beta hydrolase [Cnuella takakiae]OLY93199.1 alpha/beta hydrolase [Cnuella takakiae]SHG24095.1 hypothetical protein SAMN05444008_12229 [Cnuella takakiae]